MPVFSGIPLNDELIGGASMDDLATASLLDDAGEDDPVVGAVAVYIRPDRSFSCFFHD